MQDLARAGLRTSPWMFSAGIILRRAIGSWGILESLKGTFQQLDRATSGRLRSADRSSKMIRAVYPSRRTWGWVLTTSPGLRDLRARPTRPESSSKKPSSSILSLSNRTQNSRIAIHAAAYAIQSGQNGGRRASVCRAAEIWQQMRDQLVKLKRDGLLRGRRDHATDPRGVEAELAYCQAAPGRSKTSNSPVPNRPLCQPGCCCCTPECLISTRINRTRSKL